MRQSFASNTPMGASPMLVRFRPQTPTNNQPYSGECSTQRIVLNKS